MADSLGNGTSVTRGETLLGVSHSPMMVTVGEFASFVYPARIVSLSLQDDRPANIKYEHYC